MQRKEADLYFFSNYFLFSLLPWGYEGFALEFGDELIDDNFVGLSAWAEPLENERNPSDPEKPGVNEITHMGKNHS